MARFLLFILITTAIAYSAFASALVIYGEDDRLEVSSASTYWQIKARSVAIQVNRKTMSDSKIKDHKIITARTIRENRTMKIDERTTIGLCEEVRFADQAQTASCTGFLIAPDLLVTAGHCMDKVDSCAGFDWVFDYKSDESGIASLDIDQKNIYSCKQIINGALDIYTSTDFALIKLDRNVEGRRPLKFNTTGILNSLDKVLVIGASDGVTLKVAGDGDILYNGHENKFVSNLDTFYGNSGSPVFNQRTGLVEGLVSTGEDDYKPDMNRMCIRINKCDQNGGECSGETASRILQIPELRYKNELHDIALSGNIAALNLIESQKTILFVDIYGDDKVSPLMQAIRNQHFEVAEKLLKMNASANHISLKGETPADMAIKYIHNEQVGQFLDLLIAHAGDLKLRKLMEKAVQYNNLAAIDYFAEKGLRPKATMSLISLLKVSPSL